MIFIIFTIGSFRHWRLKDALAYYDNQIDRENNLSCIFIEPPDDGNTSSDDTDNELPATVSVTKCEVVLRSGKRYQSQKVCDFKKNSLQLENGSDVQKQSRLKNVCDQNRVTNSDNRSKKTSDNRKSVITSQKKCSQNEASSARPKRKQSLNSGEVNNNVASSEDCKRDEIQNKTRSKRPKRKQTPKSSGENCIVDEPGNVKGKNFNDYKRKQK